MKLRYIHTPLRSFRARSEWEGAYRQWHDSLKKMMWGCVAIVVLAVTLSVALANPVYLLFLIPCMLMMGAMVWMMSGGMGGGSRGGKR